jgi:molybdopterin biosynthesis enzyme
MSNTKLKVAILVVSETASRDAASDKCIPTLTEVFGNLGSDQWEIAATEIVPDSVLEIQKHVRVWTDSEAYMNLIVTSGGTGFATKDVTPEVWIKHFVTCKYSADYPKGRYTAVGQASAGSCVRSALQLYEACWLTSTQAWHARFVSGCHTM